MKYIVGINEVKEVGKSIQNYAQNDLHNNIFELHKMKLNMKWQGPAKQMFSEKFDSALERLYKMERSIEACGEFLSHSGESFGECVDELQEDWEKHLREQEEKFKTQNQIDLM